MAIADRHDLVVIEDAAQAHGARYQGHMCAVWDMPPGLVSTGENLGALGDAGAVTTNDDVLAEAVRSLRNYGSQKNMKMKDWVLILVWMNCRLLF